jgi:hypothetical protein
MSEEAGMKFSKSDPSKLDLILLTIQRLQEDVELAKCQSRLPYGTLRISRIT